LKERFVQITGFTDYIFFLFPGTTKTVHIFHNSEQPASVFSILDTGNKQIPIVADGLFDLLMLKITPNYTSKKQPKVDELQSRDVK